MSALDQILPARELVANPFTGEVIDRDDPEALAAGLAEIEAYLDELYGKHRNVYRARDEIKARLGEISPTDLPARRNQTDKQAKIDRCPRCRTRLPQVQIIEDSEPEPSVQPEAQVGADPARGADNLDVAGPASSGSEQYELLPEGPRSAEQDAALGLTVFGEKLEKPELQRAQEAASPQDAPAPGEGEVGGTTSPSSPTEDPIIAQAGEVVIPRGNRAGKTVAQVAESEPEWCLWYLENGLTPELKAAITTYLYAVKPELMEGR